MKEYPKWIYHKTLTAKIVESKEEHDAQGSGWEETPFTIDQEPNATSSESSQNQGSKKEEQGQAIKEKDFAKMKVADLKAYLIEAGFPESEIKLLPKDELIAKIGSL